MFSSPFSSTQKQISIPKDAEIVFVSDLFVEDYIGGAELTSQALIDSCPLKIFKLHSKDVDLNLLEQGHRKYWVFGNFSNMNLNLIPTIVANMKYSILEYDYKFCKYRSVEKHATITGNDCDCHHDMHGKTLSAFFLGSKSLWWMSEKQQTLYERLFPFLAEKETTVLSSVFDDNFFAAIKILREKYKNKERKGWLVLGSTSWIKGTQAAEKWCKENNKDYQVILGWPYEKVLEQMAQAEGFVYLPPGGDTCPRMVIEAKLLECQLHINDNVQHKNEIWFDTDDMFDTEAYLYAARNRFWTAIQASMNYIPDISGYITTLNCIERKYPWKHSIKSLLGFCREVVVVDGGSEDGTWEELKKIAENNPRIKISQVLRDWNHPRFAVYDGAQKAEARKVCTGDFCWQQDADEIVHENDYEKIISIARNFPPNVNLISLPVIEYWGSADKVRIDVNPWKWRLSKNIPEITHGIPEDLRKYDKDGNLYASLGTDGCDYIHIDTGHRIPHACFYNGEIHQLRVKALSNDKAALQQYDGWFKRVIELLPGIHHYSWFDINRKIKTYRDYWSQHWQSLYDIKQEDTPENNMFFNKSWSEVQEEDIENLSKRLSEEMGGWVFHERVNFDAPTPYLTITKSQPEIIEEK